MKLRTEFGPGDWSAPGGRKMSLGGRGRSLREPRPHCRWFCIRSRVAYRS
jgi:hypothetical protein